MADAIQNGTLDISQTIQLPSTGSDPLSSQAQSYLSSLTKRGIVTASNNFFNKNISVSTPQYSITGNIYIAEPEFQIKPTYVNHSLNSLVYSLTCTTVTSLTLTCTATINIPANEQTIGQPITLPIINIPVPILDDLPIVPVLELKVGNDNGSITAGFSTTVSSTTTVTASIQYANGQWTQVGNTSPTFTDNWSGINLALNSNIKVYAGPEFSLMAYGIAGVEGQVHGFLEFDQNLSDWQLLGGFDALLGVKLVFLKTYEYQTNPWTIYETQLAPSSTPSPTPTSSTPSPNPSPTPTPSPSPSLSPTPIPSSTPSSVAATSIFVSNGTVYTAGQYYSDGYNSLPCYWTGTIRTNLPGGIGAVANSIYVSGNTVYTAGRISGTGNDACYWTGTTQTYLPNGSSYYEGANSIYVSGNTVYIAGWYCNSSYGYCTPCFWTGTTRNDLLCSDGTANAIFVANGTVYIAGTNLTNFDYYGCYWINGIGNTLPCLFGANSIYVYNGMLYISGNSPCACYWTGVPQTLSSTPSPTQAWTFTPTSLAGGGSGNNSAAYSIFVSNGTVYTAGSWYDGSKSIPCYWTNTIRTDLSNNGGGAAKSIFVFNNVVYTAGSTSNGACYWIGTTRTDLP